MITSGPRNAQQPSGMPIAKYRPFLESNPVEVLDRQWPDKEIVSAPRWLSTDLRDGNQALVEPMDPARKRLMFDLLVRMGFKEIEIGFPAASQTDFDFVRSLIETNAVPSDVTVSVLTLARADIITRTIEALVGFERATVHVYNATSPFFREVVFGNDKQGTIDLATAAVKQIMEEADRILDGTVVGLEYSPEIFIDTEQNFALEICEAVMDVWQPGPDREIILNLPATVERSTPNVYADQVEYMSRNLSRREHVTVSVHPHNDRGTGVASAELAMLAGADRVEGCLFGQGERTGNVDLVTLALNLYTQGIDPHLDLSDIDDIRRTVEYCTGMGVHDRAPYAGDLVYTSFSGSHQDAIRKGFAARDKAVAAAGGNDLAVAWQIPYLPIDPADVGRSYEAVVRVNSQSGKGGVAFLMASAHNLELPRRLQIEFSKIVQGETESEGGEVSVDTMWRIFADAYLPTDAAEGLEQWGRFVLGKTSVEADEDGAHLRAEVFDNGERVELEAVGSGPVDAFVGALRARGFDLHILDYSEHALGSGRDAKAAAYIEAELDGNVVWGGGIDSSIGRASYKAVISALNRALGRGQVDTVD